MSDERKKRSRAWIEPVIFLAFFCLNVLAAYAPTPLMLREVFDSSEPKGVLFRVPVALAYELVHSYTMTKPFDGIERIIQVDRELHRTGRWLVVAFLLLLFVASAAFYNSRNAWVAMPIIVFVYSSLQAFFAMVSIALNGLNGV
jgi:hypothetical protein